MRTTHPPTSRPLRTATVLLAQMAVVGLVYRGTLRLAFLSDAWVYLARLRAGVWPILARPTGYHYQPVACAWTALIRAAFGEDAFAYQAVNLAELALLGFLAYQLGCRLLGDASAAFLASLLVLGSASFYEASYSPLAGNMHLLAGNFYVLSVIVAHDVAAGRFGRRGPWLLGLVVLAATFSHPAMVTAIPVCAWTVYVISGARDRTESHGARPGMAGVLLALGAVGLVFVWARVAFAAEAIGAPRPSLDPMRAYWLVSRGFLAAFSLRGSDETLHALTTLGSNVPVPGRWIWAFVGGWLLIATCAVAVAITRISPPGVRVLSGFLGMHVLILAIAAPMSSRQGHVPAVAAALLTAWVLSTLAERVAAKAGTPARATAVRQIPAVVVLLLIWGARPDHDAAAHVHARAASLSRALVEQVTTVPVPVGGLVNLTLVNMPGHTSDRGVHAAIFENGLQEEVRLATAVAAVDLWRVPLPGAPDNFAGLSLPADVERLRGRLLDPSTVVLLFETGSPLTILTTEHLDRLSERSTRLE